jgi:CRISPR system Cascade subunit CasA
VFSFNLTENKWIPCILSDGTVSHFSLIEIFSEAHNIEEISDQSPLVTVALHRLLLAIIHRSFERGYGPIDMVEWKALWDKGKFEYPQHYLKNMYQRFDLFDANCPFYQSASLLQSTIKSEPISIGNLIHESSIHLSKAVLFDHDMDTSFRVLSPAEAIRFLLAFQSFVVGGFSGLSRPRLKGEESARAGALIRSAVCIMHGGNLFETLMLNLHVYNLEDEQPFATAGDDRPIWEADDQLKSQERRPKGYLDLLTWQSRRILLIPESGLNGQIIIKKVLIRKGNEFSKDFSLHGKEPMLAFRKIKKPLKGTDPWTPVSFQEDKVLWRDSLSLFQSIKDNHMRPKILDWLNDLVVNDILPLSSVYNMAIMGFISDQAYISLWRHERLPLPVKYLNDEKLIVKLKEALALAEDMARGLESAIWNLAKLNIAPEADKLSETQKKEVGNFSEYLSPTRPYWASLGIAFNRLVTDLAQDKTPDGEYGSRVLPWWAEQIRKFARQSFRDTTNSFNRGGRMLKAVTLAENHFNLKLNMILKAFQSPYQEFKKEVK